MLITHPLLVDLWITALLAHGRPASLPPALADQLVVCRTFVRPRA